MALAMSIVTASVGCSDGQSTAQPSSSDPAQPRDTTPNARETTTATTPDAATRPTNEPPSCLPVAGIDQSKYEALGVGRRTFAPFTVVQFDDAIQHIWSSGRCENLFEGPTFSSDVCFEYSSEGTFMQACGDLPRIHRPGRGDRCSGAEAGRPE